MRARSLRKTWADDPANPFELLEGPDPMIEHREKLRKKKKRLRRHSPGDMT